MDVQAIAPTPADSLRAFGSVGPRMRCAPLLLANRCMEARAWSGTACSCTHMHCVESPSSPERAKEPRH
eukprot:8926200-Alexandrium_andersonii.AAC.1